MMFVRRCPERCLADGVTGASRCERRRGHEGRHHVEVTMGPDKYPTVHRWPNTADDDLEMRDSVVMRRVLRVGVVAVTCLDGLFVALTGPKIGDAMILAVAYTGLIVGEVIYRKERNGLRQAARDRERAGTGTDDSAGLTVGGAAGNTFTNVAVTTRAAQFAALASARTGNAPIATAANIARLALANGITPVQVEAWPVDRFIAALNALPPARPGAEEDTRLTERAGDLPILGFKAAQLLFGFGDRWGARLDSVYGAHWTGTSEAICAKGAHDGPVPYEWCTCGFYARRNPDDVPRGGDANEVRVDVELSGRVIVYERGYRAQKQKILRVGIAPCWYCGVPSTVVGGVAPTPFTDLRQPLVAGTPLVGFCDAHIALADANITIPISELAEQLGVPVDTAPQLQRRHDGPYGT